MYLKRIQKKIKDIYRLLLHGFMVRSFNFWQKIGLHLTVNHYYFPIPDTRELKDEIWRKESEMAGIEMRDKEQLALLAEFKNQFKNEYDSFPMNKGEKEYEYFIDNDGLTSMDGEVLYCMVRYFKPRRIIEVGAGYSTLASAQAIRKNIDPA